MFQFYMNMYKSYIYMYMMITLKKELIHDLKMKKMEEKINSREDCFSSSIIPTEMEMETP